MTDEANKAGEGGGRSDAELEPEVPEVDVPALSALLKRSLGASEPVGARSAGAQHDKQAAEKDRALLAGVQRKLRQRSKGKFYADGWSTSQSRINYVLIAAVMLIVIAVVYLVMGPTGISLN